MSAARYARSMQSVEDGKMKFPKARNPEITPEARVTESYDF